MTTSVCGGAGCCERSVPHASGSVGCRGGGGPRLSACEAAGMDISGVDLSAVRFPAVSTAMDGLLPGREQLSTGGDLLGLICPELGVTPLVDPGTDLEDERPTPVGSPVAAIDEGMPLSPTLDTDVEVARALLEVGAGDGDAHCGPRCRVFLVPGDIFCASGFCDVGRGLVSAGVAAPVSLAVGSPARSEIPLRLVSPPASVVSSGLPPSSSAMRPTPDVGPPSSLAAAEQEFPLSTSLPLELSAESTMLPPPLTPRRMVGGWLFLGRWCPPRPGIPRWLGATRDCPIYLWKAPLTFTRIGRCRGFLRECWMACRVASIA